MIQIIVLAAVVGVVLFSVSALLDEIDHQLVVIVLGTWFIMLSLLLLRYSSIRLPTFASLREGDKDQLTHDIRLLLQKRVNKSKSNA